MVPLTAPPLSWTQLHNIGEHVCVCRLTFVVPTAVLFQRQRVCDPWLADIQVCFHKVRNKWAVFCPQHTFQAMNQTRLNTEGDQLNPSPARAS